MQGGAGRVDPVPAVAHRRPGGEVAAARSRTGHVLDLVVVGDFDRAGQAFADALGRFGQLGAEPGHALGGEAHRRPGQAQRATHHALHVTDHRGHAACAQATFLIVDRIALRLDRGDHRFDLFAAGRAVGSERRHRQARQQRVALAAAHGRQQGLAGRGDVQQPALADVGVALRAMRAGGALQGDHFQAVADPQAGGLAGDRAQVVEFDVGCGHQCRGRVRLAAELQRAEAQAVGAAGGFAAHQVAFDQPAQHAVGRGARQLHLARDLGKRHALGRGADGLQDIERPLDGAGGLARGFTHVAGHPGRRAGGGQSSARWAVLAERHAPHIVGQIGSTRPRARSIRTACARHQGRGGPVHQSSVPVTTVCTWPPDQTWPSPSMRSSSRASKPTSRPWLAT